FPLSRLCPPSYTLFPYTTLFRSSVVQPNFSSFLTDRFITLLEYKQMKPVLLITKIDLANESELKKIKDITAYYEAIGYSVLIKLDRKSTRLNSSHVSTSYAVFCL